MNIRRILAVWAAKATGFACKKMGHEGAARYYAEHGIAVDTKGE